MPLTNINVFYSDDIRDPFLVATATVGNNIAETGMPNYFMIELIDVLWTRTDIDPLERLPGGREASGRFRIEGMDAFGDRIVLDNRFLFSLRGDTTHRHLYISIKFQNTAVASATAPGLKSVTEKDAAPVTLRTIPKSGRTPIGRCLNIGVNVVDKENHYFLEGFSVINDLLGCEADAIAMKRILEAEGYESIQLLSKDATRESLIEHVSAIAQELQSGDIFVLTYSGHGARIPELTTDTLHADEGDELDETWLLYNGMLLDDELYELWGLFDEGVRIVVLSDSCHSGTVTRALTSIFSSVEEENRKMFKPTARQISKDVEKEILQKNGEFYNKLRIDLSERPLPDIKASIRLISGCQDEQESLEVTIDSETFEVHNENTNVPRERRIRRGLFTKSIEEIWTNGTSIKDYNDLVTKIQDKITAAQGTQIPNHLSIGPTLSFFDEESPFIINSQGAKETGSISQKIKKQKPGKGLLNLILNLDREKELQLKEEAINDFISKLPNRKPIGLSLHIGLDKVDKNHYSGWGGELCGAEHDADLMHRLFTVFPSTEQTFKGDVLLGAEATRNELIKKVKTAAAELEAGDIFVLTFAGNGGQTPDITKTESSSYNQTWCLYDGQIIDDELFEFWTWFKKGVRILVISDSCNSDQSDSKEYKKLKQGKISSKTYCHSRAMSIDIANKVYFQNQSFYDKAVKEVLHRGSTSIKATIRMMTASQNKRPAFEHPSGVGFFTNALFEAWDYGRFEGNYISFFEEVKSYMPDDQQPMNFVYGPEKEQYDKESPFTIHNNSIFNVFRGVTKDALTETVRLNASKGMIALLETFGARVLVDEVLNTNTEISEIVYKTFIDGLGGPSVEFVNFLDDKAMPPEKIPAADSLDRFSFIKKIIPLWEYINADNSRNYSIQLYENIIRAVEPEQRNTTAINHFKLDSVTTNGVLEVERQLNYIKHLMNSHPARLIGTKINPKGHLIPTPKNSVPKNIRDEWIDEFFWTWMP